MNNNVSIKWLAAANRSHVSIRVTKVFGQGSGVVDSSMNSAHHRASFLSASSQHSGDWLFALPIASCGLMLDDEAVSDSVVYATVSTQYQHYTDGQTDRNDM